MSLSYGTIRRRYEQGLDSIVRLVTGLEDRIEELTAMHVSAPQISIQRLTNHIKQLKQALDNKDKELAQAHQLNVRLLAFYDKAGSAISRYFAGLYSDYSLYILAKTKYNGF